MLHFVVEMSEIGDEIIRSMVEGNNLYFHKIDLNSIQEIENFYNQTIKRFKRVDALVLYAGITPVSSIVDTEEELYDSVFNINLKAPYFLRKACVAIHDGEPIRIYHFLWISPHGLWSGKQSCLRLNKKYTLHFINSYCASLR